MSSDASSTHDDADDLLYRGQHGRDIPYTLNHVRVHPSVTAIGEQAFSHWFDLESVELCEGLEVIGADAFQCCRILENCIIPSTVKLIGYQAFQSTPLRGLNLPDSVEAIGPFAFNYTNLVHLRIPPLITVMRHYVLANCRCMFSLELPESLGHIEEKAFEHNYCLRNVAIPLDAVIEEGVFQDCVDLDTLFGNANSIVRALRHRFDGLPIHKMLYYQSYRPIAQNELLKATDMRSGQTRTLRSKLDPTGRHRDCLGMTPLHILACSTVQELPLYQLMIQKYPENLIVSDRWGALPILYAVWRNAPNEIVRFLFESQQSIYPDHELDWNGMILTLGNAEAPCGAIQHLVDAQQSLFPRQRIIWEGCLDYLASHLERRDETFQVLLKCSIEERVNAIGVKLWREDIIQRTEQICSINTLVGDEDCQWIIQANRTRKLAKLRSKLAFFETEYEKLNEAMSMLELAI
mmetsp:Transcript_12564/g.26751  ORF Transcript_12564/g.26751 Transcript_12564/m.26751 type:complete len:464 (+) Transcript_12564:149-1540(+)|eukprot:CAMPEP_0183737016 /NCGR_PEP_ID=MMETSP0737-20130205/50862_1 /TAXON_ID=385413 /ORGANISM="Thalassiosira miniscula, Strain CCMP1093" /LENGTH=463 /DNA_ID=CAMNT_0025971197 /DNA_START=43 /DNA_END=1434 /DNA_ORIENTATION=+